MNIPLQLILASLIVLGGLFIHEAISRVALLTVPSAQYGLLSLRFTPGTLLFGSDIMLGRSVEVLMGEEGTSTPFENIRALVSEYDVAIANFEASVPEMHVPTLPLTMQFSVKEAYLGAVREAGFDVLSLANNHALDHGELGYQNTKEACALYDLVCAGHPRDVDAMSVVTTQVGDVRVSVLMLHTLYGDLSTTTLEERIGEMVKESDIQYAFIHWGEEYVHTHNEAQETLAHFLIETGIDAVIGHHPHVIQDIEEYKGKPIFYSLGNLIFDQYFSKAVQEGYLLGITFTKRQVSYELIPYDMHEKRSVPKPQEGDARTATVSGLLSPNYFTDEERGSGIIEYAR